MTARDTHLTQRGAAVQQLLDTVENLGPATQEDDGLMSKHDKTRLDDGVADTPLTNLEILAIINS